MEAYWSWRVREEALVPPVPVTFLWQVWQVAGGSGFTAGGGKSTLTDERQNLVGHDKTNATTSPIQ